MKYSIEFLAGVVYIATFVGVALGDVGEMSSPATIYKWWFPASVATALAIPFILGYLAGKR